MNPVRLAEFHNEWYSPGRSAWVRAVWFLAGLPLLRASWIPLSGFRAGLLRLFGARVGRGVVIKPGVRVKYIRGCSRRATTAGSGVGSPGSTTCAPVQAGQQRVRLAGGVPVHRQPRLERTRPSA